MEEHDALEGLTRAGETEFRSRMNERTAAHLHLVGSDAARRRIEHQTAPRQPVEALDESEYRPPVFLRRVLPAEEIEELSAILLATKETTDEHVGEHPDAVYAVRNGDPEIVALQARLIAWIERYVERRIAKPNPRDGGNPVVQQHRIEQELAPFLYELADRGANALVMGRAVRYFSWLIFKRTWGPLVRFKRGWGTLDIDWGKIDRRNRKYCAELISRGGWHNEDELRLFCEAYGGGPPDGERAAEVRPRLALLARRIGEMRPFLVNRYKPERTIVELAPGLWVAWLWGQAHMLGSVFAARSERELREHLACCLSVAGVGIGLDGRMAVPALLWIDIDTQPGLPGAWAFNLALVQAIHDRLGAFYDRIDFQSLLAGRWPAQEGSDEPDPDEDERLAASCAILARAGAPTGVEGRGGVLRSERLFEILRRLGCEIRQGKGSEVVIHRPGKRLFRLGHHGRNPEVGWVLVKRILRRIEIPVEDWLAAAR